MPFTNKVAIITGAGQGLGLDYAKALLAQGARVVISDLGTDRAGEGEDQALVTEALQALKAQGGEAVAHIGRLDDEAGCQQLIDLAIEQFGQLDILIHNAGWVGYQDIEEQEEVRWASACMRRCGWPSTPGSTSSARRRRGWS